jgi:hypothetical protein
VEGYVFEEADFYLEGYDLAEVGGGAEVASTGAELGEAKVAGAGDFEAGGDEAGIEIDDGAELDLDAEGRHGGRDGFSFDDPAAAFDEDTGEVDENCLAVIVGEAFDIERLHG